MASHLPEDLQQLTPMVRQFYELKAKAEDAILFFRMGDFYEIFGDDAERVAPVLDLVLTSREKGDKTRLPFCGVPHHSARGYWLKLLRLGYRVAIADQMEDPAEAKGLVRRDIVQVMTPGCIDDLEGLEADLPNHLLAFHEVPSSGSCLLAALDTSTGEFRIGAIERGDLLSWMERLRPRECLTRKFLQDEVKSLLTGFPSLPALSFGILPEAILRDKDEQQRLLVEHFATSDLATMPCGDVTGGRELVAAVLLYLKSLHASTRQFLVIKPLHDPDRMLLDETVRRDLELFETARRREVDGSLFKEINATRTPMGARLLRHDLGQPFLREESIRLRQDAVASLLAAPHEALAAVQSQLKVCVDVDRLMTRVIARKAQPGDLLQIRRCLQASLEIRQMFQAWPVSSPLLQTINLSLDAAKQPLDLLQSQLSEELALLGSLAVFKPGWDAQFDSLTLLAREGASQIDAYEQKLRVETGINSLKIKEHKTYGLLIEVTKSNLSKVPSHFIRRQTMVNNERFATMELEELSESLATASEDAISREAELFAALLEQLAAAQAPLRELAAALALLDVLQSFASKARQSHYVRPELSRKGDLTLQACRHPVVERFVGQHAFMPNDVRLTRDKKQMLISGPNMAGKSTVMRQTALAAILHQIGSFVPATLARLPLFDRVFTRVGAADDLSRGQSTFMVEMAEAASILRQASEHSLVILDEVGRGTSTQDGLAIAAAILEYISENLRSYTLFATHYHELIPYSAHLPSVAIAQVEVLEEKQGIRFTHRLIEGASGSSFGVEVAKLAGIPPGIIEKAKRYLIQPETFVLAESKVKTRRSAAVSAQMAPLELGFEESAPLRKGELPSSIHSIVERLERVNVLKTTPMQALAILDELKGYLQQNAQGSLFPEAPHLC